MQFALNSEWQITAWDKDAETVSGFTFDEVIGRNFLDDIVDFGDVDAVQRVLCKACYHQEGVRDFNFTLYSKSATPTELLLDVSPHFDQMTAVGVSIIATHAHLIEEGGVAGDTSSVDDVLTGASDVLQGKAHAFKRARIESISQASTGCPSMEDLPPMSSFFTPSMEELPPVSED
mmetsp:Transcript_58044/g.109380  ORF Transcript_58044/g.109380 Transcript_58044/m.109380 type:complete len:176 (+) Transcript_58044:71-598(+)